MDREDGSMILVERGYVNVYYNTDLVDTLKKEISGRRNLRNSHCTFYYFEGK
jgi:cytochrome oxidase assembly protein ShyY1